MIEFKHVTTVGRGFHLRDISFRLQDGYIMALAGENGAGKTTLLRHILEPGISYEGRILVDGIDLKEDRNACMDRIAYVSDDHRLPEVFTVYDTCGLYRGFYDHWDQKGLDHWLERMGLLREKQVRSLSRGEYFRMQIAMGLAHRARIFLMDEVTSGMDPIFRRELWRLMREITISGADIVLVTHSMDEIQQKCDYRGILEAGKLVKWEEADLT